MFINNGFNILSLLVSLVCTVPGLCHHHPDHHEENLTINTSLGKIQGSLLKTRLGKSIFAFRGIRYAKAPVDELRFKPPVPVEKWEGIFNATVDGPRCPQPGNDPVSEDCLLLNVYSTKLPSAKENPKRPVIIHIHAGGFYSGTGMSIWAGPQYFMDQDIVLVTFNYRLGSLGFISTGDKYAPGNNGLKDQVIAMRWVKDNIVHFGGDPDSITLLGYSAGSWSINLHMVSPMSRGLFHKAIALSGSALGIWPLPTNQFGIAQKQAKFLGCPEDTSSKIINCLKTKPAEDIANTLAQFREFGFDPVLIWSPVIEEDYGQERFLPENPVKLIREAKFMKIPFITGVTKDEFGYLAFPLIGNQTLLEQFDTQFEKYAPISFIYERNTPKSKKVSKTIRKYYFGDRHIDNTSFDGLSKAYYDSIEGFPMNRAVKLMATYNNKPVYYYRFSYQGRYSHFYLPGTDNTPYGVVHHDDLIYLFYISKLFPFFKSSDPEVVMVNKLTKLYANFAKTGNPTPASTDALDNVNWETFNMSTQKYLEIGNKLVMKDHLEEERYQMWEKLYPLSEN